MSESFADGVNEDGEYFCNTVLALNAGSSSLKFGLYWTVEEYWIGHGQISGLGEDAVFTAFGRYPAPQLPRQASLADAIDILFEWFAKSGWNEEIDAIGHRLVHGGDRFITPVIVNDEIEAELEGLSWLAPLHMPAALGVLRRTRQAFPLKPSIACFDTAFHANLPEVERRLPIPLRLHQAGYRRYGFHGLSYESVVEQLPKLLNTPLPRRIVAAHLGSGSSLCAILDGKSVATTMGFSTADGVPMGTRTGALDPGLLMALQRQGGLPQNEVEDLVYRQGGLLAVSGFSGDMRALLQSDLPEAKAAVDYYCYWVARHAASLVCTLGGLDAFVFTGGIGENAAPVRRLIVNHLGWLGLGCDDENERSRSFRISPPQGKVPVYVLGTGEEYIMVEQVCLALWHRRNEWLAQQGFATPSA